MRINKKITRRSTKEILGKLFKKKFGYKIFVLKKIPLFLNK